MQQALAALGDRKGSSISSVHQYLAREHGADAPTRAQIGQVMKRAAGHRLCNSPCSSQPSDGIMRKADGAKRFRLTMGNLQDAVAGITGRAVASRGDAARGSANNKRRRSRRRKGKGKKKGKKGKGRRRRRSRRRGKKGKGKKGKKGRKGRRRRRKGKKSKK